MRICGIMLTHDGAIAFVEDGRLVFCVEQEERDNNPRYPIVDKFTKTRATEQSPVDTPFTVR